jgi:hypothetical protein
VGEWWGYVVELARLTHERLTESLKAAWEHEIKEAVFAKLPPDYAIIAKVLLEVCVHN